MRVIIQRNVYCLINNPAAGTYHNFYNTSDLNGKEVLDIQVLYRGLQDINIGGQNYTPMTSVGAFGANVAFFNMRQDKSLIYAHFNLPVTSTINVNTDIPAFFAKDFKKRYRVCGCFDWFNSNVYLSVPIVGPPAGPYYLAVQVTYIDSDK